jgi:hypothetical protein
MPSTIDFRRAIGPDCIEVKHDRYRLIVRRHGKTVRA